MARPARWILVTAVAVAAAGGACATPVPTARSADDYDRKAVHTAEEVRSAVQTAVVALQAAEDGRLLDRTLDVLVTEAEDDANGAAETFLAVQPASGAHADATRAELADLLDEATGELAAARIAVRRGDAAARHDGIEPLDELADALEAYAKAVG
jgi:type IV pilus biogenesis protein CpaD/CtpE